MAIAAAESGGTAMRAIGVALGFGIGFLTAFVISPASAGLFSFSTGDPDGKIATLSRPAGGGAIQTETADDFIFSQKSRIDHATFVGLLPSGTLLTSIADVEIEFYHVFPKDSTNPPSSHVPTRVNSPADVEIGAATRDGVAGTLSFIPTLLSSSFTASNSVVNGIHPLPDIFTGGEGTVTGEEVRINVSFTTPVTLGADHYFFRPEVLLSSGEFLWLSAAKPIVPPGTPFVPDLQAWIRNDDLAPDWLRIGTDITHQGPFNMTFSLDGVAGVPELGTWAMMIIGFGGVGVRMRRRVTAIRPVRAAARS
jgi:hypothetical protein